MLDKLKKIRIELTRVLLNFAEITTDDGIVILYDGETLEIGTSVFSLDENGEQIPLVDGSYIVGDVTYVSIDGKISEIIGEVKPEDETEIEIEMESVSTVDGIVLQYVGDTLAVDVVVTLEDGSIPADGDYTVDTKVYTIVGGIVTAVNDVKPEDKPVDEEPSVEMAKFKKLVKQVTQLTNTVIQLNKKIKFC